MELTENSRIGLIYKIVGYGLTYYGSTIQLLSDRKSTHITQYRMWVNRGEDAWKCASYDILKQGDEWEMIVLETIITDIKKTGLIEREQKWITENECVNKNQAIQSVDDLKKYKREWAENNRREQGIEPRTQGFDHKKYARDWARAKRAEMTDAERAEVNRKKRENRPEQTEEQKEKARERAKAQREKIKADPEQVAKVNEYKKAKVREYRNKKKE